MSTSKDDNSAKKSTSESNQHKQDIKEAFQLFDEEDTGFIKSNQLKYAMRALGFEPRKEEVKNILKELDKEGSGCVAFAAFEAMMYRKLSEKDANDEILKAFQLFDTNGTGHITVESLRAISKQLGESVADDELVAMIQEADKNQDGKVDRNEFLDIMKKTCLY